MKPILYTAITLFIPFLFFQSCCKPLNGKKNSKDLMIVADSLQKIYAPDKRVKLWITSVTDSTFSLWVDEEKTYNEVNSLIKERFSEFKVSIVLLPESNRNQLVTGLINNSVANLRTKPKHSAEMATQALLGTPVRVYKKQGEWYLVQTPNRYIAWIDSAALVTVDKQKLETWKKSRKVVFEPVSGFSYSQPDENSQTISDLVMGCTLPVTETRNNFLKVFYPDGRTAWVKQKEVIDFNELINRKPSGESLVRTAKQFLGFPYLWGGTSAKAVDCSGFTSTIYYMNGVLLQRDASQQTKYGKQITTSFNSRKLQPGDLLFFGRPATPSKKERVTHVAMYIGNKQFIHASGKVRINSMDNASPGFIRSYPPRFVRAVRVTGNVNGNGIEYLKDNKFYKEIIN